MKKRKIFISKECKENLCKDVIETIISISNKYISSIFFIESDCKAFKTVIKTEDNKIDKIIVPNVKKTIKGYVKVFNENHTTSISFYSDK